MTPRMRYDRWGRRAVSESEGRRRLEKLDVVHWIVFPIQRPQSEIRSRRSGSNQRIRNLNTVGSGIARQIRPCPAAGLGIQHDLAPSFEKIPGDLPFVWTNAGVHLSH